MSNSAKCLLIAAYILAVLGLIMIYSASAVSAEHIYGNPQYFLLRQIIFLLIGTAALYSVSAISPSYWKQHSKVILLFSIFLLVLVFVPYAGKAAGGARRWIQLGFFNFQPAEFSKIAICLYLADYLSRKRKFIRQGNVRIFFPPLVIVGMMCSLILLQPDLGSCVFVVLIACILFFWAGIKMRYVLVAVAAILPVFYFLIARVPYRLSRVTAYLNPWDDPQGSGFQMIQSFLSYGIGGVKGAGLGQGIQKLFYLPSGHNDFIFSVIGEELGLIGLLFVMILFVVILVSGLRMTECARNDYEKLLTAALTFSIVMQGLIHMLVATGLIPTKGLPLPFVSYGGTSLVFNLIAVGLLLGMDRARCLKNKGMRK